MNIQALTCSPSYPPYNFHQQQSRFRRMRKSLKERTAASFKPVVQKWLIFQGIFIPFPQLPPRHANYFTCNSQTWKTLLTMNNLFSSISGLGTVKNSNSCIWRHMSFIAWAFLLETLRNIHSIRSVVSHKDLEMVSDVEPKILAYFLTIQCQLHIQKIEMSMGGGESVLDISIWNSCSLWHFSA